MAQWFYTQSGGQQAGPVDEAQLKQMVAAGQLGPADMIWREGLANWQQVAATSEVAGAMPVNPFPGQPGQPMGYAAPAYPVGYAPNAVSYRKDAQNAMICSLVGLVCLGIILGTIGLIQGLNAKKKMAASGNFDGQGMATAAIVVGIVDICFFVLFIGVRFGMH